MAKFDLNLSFTSVKQDRVGVKLYTKDKIDERAKVLNYSIYRLLDKVAKDVKCYESISEKQAAIMDILNKIKKSNSTEEILELRKKLNRYLNKVKTDIKDKEIPAEVLNTYNGCTADVRKSIATYLRVLKRQQNIESIEKQLRKKRLTEEAKDALKKEIQKEKRFNTRWANKNLEPQKVVKQEPAEVVAEKTVEVVNEKAIEKVEENIEEKIKNKIDLREFYAKFYKELEFIKTKLKGLKNYKLSQKKQLLIYCIALSCLSASSKEYSPNKIAEYQEYGVPQKVLETVTLSEEEMDKLFNELNDEIIEKSRETRTVSENTRALTTEEKREIIKNAYFEEMSYEVRKRELLTTDQLNTLLRNMCEENPLGIIFEDEFTALSYIYNAEEPSYNIKMLIIMARENLAYDQLNTICAGVIAEAGGGNYDEAYRVASVIYNRAHCSRYISLYGDNLYQQFIANAQFSVYGLNLYQKYLDRDDLKGYKATIDMFYSRIPSIDYLSFRAQSVEIAWVTHTFMNNGNKFGVPIKDSERVESTYIEIIEKELNEYLNLNNDTLLLELKN